ncbi:MAG: leucine-rich repeat domain-containing protein [Bacteroidales bacterium]|nr:leucine-rich repeat domain-containing protein [Bacteroidales bacterium]
MGNQEFYNGRPIFVASNSYDLEEAVKEYKSKVSPPYVVKIPKQRKVDFSAFDGDETVGIVLFEGNEVTKIEAYAFYHCTNLESIQLPASLKKIESSAFSECKKLKNIVLPNSLLQLESNLFEESSLTDIVIPASVAKIGNYVFANCPKLKSIEVEAENPKYCSVDGVLFDKKMKTLLRVPVQCDIKNYIIPDTVTKIKEMAFDECTRLKSIAIPASVTKIEDGSFDKCTSLQKFEVASENKNYVSIDGVLFDKEVKTLLRFPINHPAKKYIIPDTVQNVGLCAFDDCNHLTSITIPASCSHILSTAFDGCSNLERIEVGKGNKRYVSIEGALIDKKKKTFLRLPKKYPLNTYTIPSSVTKIGDSAFEGCVTLANVIIPDTVAKVGSSAFLGCTELQGVVIPSSVTKIEWESFSGCTSLKNVVIPNSVTEIDDSAFSGCTALISVVIPASVTELDESAFADCTSLENIQVDKDNPNYASINGVLFDKSKETLLQYPLANSRTEYHIPASVTDISWSAFKGVKNLVHVIIPLKAFRNCYFDVVEIFDNCPKVKEITIKK